MPIYEYGCDNCGKLTEVLQKLSDPPPERCEHCGSKRLKRVMSRTSFQLKGDGWYITDYARKEKKGGSKEAGESGASESGSSDSKSSSDGASSDSAGSTSSASAGKSDGKKKTKGKKQAS